MRNYEDITQQTIREYYDSLRDKNIKTYEDSMILYMLGTMMISVATQKITEYSSTESKMLAKEVLEKTGMFLSSTDYDESIHHKVVELIDMLMLDFAVLQHRASIEEVN